MGTVGESTDEVQSDDETDAGGVRGYGNNVGGILERDDVMRDGVCLPSKTSDSLSDVKISNVDGKSRRSFSESVNSSEHDEEFSLVGEEYLSAGLNDGKLTKVGEGGGESSSSGTGDVGGEGGGEDSGESEDVILASSGIEEIIGSVIIAALSANSGVLLLVLVSSLSSSLVLSCARLSSARSISGVDLICTEMSSLRIVTVGEISCDTGSRCFAENVCKIASEVGSFTVRRRMFLFF